MAKQQQQQQQSEGPRVKADRKAAVRKSWSVPLRLITLNDNPRNPLSDELQKMGISLFAATESMPSLWSLGVSDDPEDRQKFVRLIQEYDQEILRVALSMRLKGQLQNIEVRDNGKRSDGTPTYATVFGARRATAALYNWCDKGCPGEPTIEAFLAPKLNETALFMRAMDENDPLLRKQPNPIELARAYERVVRDTGSAAKAAEQVGVAKQTVLNYLKLLELPEKQQQKIASGEVKKTVAFKGEAGDRLPDDRPKRRTLKQITDARREYADDTPVGKVLAWVLGERETLT